MNASVDKRGRRTSSPSADLIYNKKLHNVPDSDGALEREINRIAKRYATLSREKDLARWLSLRERLVSKCFNFFYVSGPNVSVREDGVKHLGSYAQVDELFQDAILKVLDRYDASKWQFTHMLRRQFANTRFGAAYEAAKYDTRYGGGKDGEPISLQDDSWSAGDGGVSVDQRLGQEDGELQRLLNGDAPASSSENRVTPMAGVDNLTADEKAEELILLELLNLVAAFLGKTGKSANQTRKTYTCMFFSETLAKAVKTRTRGELGAFSAQEKRLFRVANLSFQDTYTCVPCRTIAELHEVEFVEGVPPLGPALRNDAGKWIELPNFKWAVPASFYIGYLESIGMHSSGPLVSQQRKKYEQLLGEIGA